MAIESCGIIGAGKVGSALAEALAEKKLLRWVVARSKEKVSAIAENAPGVCFFGSIADIDHLADMIIIAVDDSSIGKAAEALADKFGQELSGKYVVHCYGIEGWDILESCHDNGAKAASIHPYQTFYYPSAKILEGISWGVSCEMEDFHPISDFIEKIGGRPIFLQSVNKELKALYHGSAVAASNYVTMVIALAKEIAVEAGINPAEFLPPIIRTTVENNVRAILQNEDIPLTGPVARADAASVRKHIASMEENSLLRECYAHLGLATAKIALANSCITDRQYEDICAVLKQSLNF